MDSYKWCRYLDTTVIIIPVLSGKMSHKLFCFPQSTAAAAVSHTQHLAATISVLKRVLACSWDRGLSSALLHKYFHALSPGKHSLQCDMNDNMHDTKRLKSLRGGICMNHSSIVSTQ